MKRSTEEQLSNSLLQMEIDRLESESQAMSHTANLAQAAVVPREILQKSEAEAVDLTHKLATTSAELRLVRTELDELRSSHSIDSGTGGSQDTERYQATASQDHAQNSELQKTIRRLGNARPDTLEVGSTSHASPARSPRFLDDTAQSN